MLCCNTLGCCKRCLEEWVETSPTCPHCRSAINNDICPHCLQFGAIPNVVKEMEQLDEVIGD